MIAFYTDALSAYPGETVSLFASSAHPDARLEIARVGAAREVVATLDLGELQDAPTPAGADRDGCGWPRAGEIAVGADWRSGYYDLVLTNGAGETSHHLLVVKPPRYGSRRARAVLVLATNTYHAYNWWGGANSYCDVTGLMARELTLAEGMARAIGVLSARRPFAQNIVAMAPDGPRLMNAGVRGFQERPRTDKPEFWREHGLSPYDGAAGFLNKWEHHFVAWAEGAGIALDYFTDWDLEAEPDVLAPYACMLAVGHSEYWSAPQRDQVERFVDGGGRLAIFSGNTCYWKVRWEDGGRTLTAHKWNGFTAEPEAGANGTHMWSHPAFERPEAALTGLTFLYGGYHRLGMCVARGSGAYTVYDDRHWALEGADLGYGDSVGLDPPLLAYENDGCRLAWGEDGLPKPAPGLGVPENLRIIAIAPCSYGEDLTRGARPVLPPEDFTQAAEIAYGDASDESRRRLLRGHAVMASFTRGQGEVFNGGTTEWAHGLKAGDPYLRAITLNVLKRFGAVG